MRKKGGRTAWEIVEEQKKDPAWVARREAQEAEMRAREEHDIAEQAMLLADLRKLGYRIKWIWDFVNTVDSYDNAIPVLVSHLRRRYSEGTREGIARALSVREARGLAGGAMVEVLGEEGLDKHLRWALANALTVVADRSDQEGIKAILATETDKDVADRLRRALKKAAKP
jgi:hypothetical protein